MKKIYLIFLVLFAIFSNAKAQELAGYKLCIDPGHGGHDPANDRKINLPNGIIYWESEGNLETALHLDTILKDLGASVLLTRTENDDSDDISLSARSTIANTFGADYFHSIHTNAYNQTTNYTLVLYKGTNSNPAFTKAKEMSDLMAPEIHKVLKTTNANSSGDESFLGFNLGVLNGANMPATLSEGAFHDVPLEGLRLKSTHYLENYAWSIAKSFMIFYNKAGFVDGRVGGIISDDVSHEAMNGVTVTATPGDYTCVVDGNYNGIYALDLPPGSYTLTLIKDGYVNKTTNVTITANNYTDLDIEMMYFNNGKPRADFTVTGLPAGAGQQISFDASNSTDPDGSIVSYAWDFGDGETGAGQTVNHTFASDATYNVKLTVTDNDSKTGSITKQIEIATNPASDARILSVINLENNDVKITWALNPESDAAYRIYVSNSDDLDDFSVLVNEDALVSGTTEHTFSGLAVNAKGYNFKISAIGGGGEGGFSDTYSRVSASDVTNLKTVLIVDGYDRLGSWGKSTHAFANTYMSTLRDAGDVVISSAANEAVVDGAVDLTNYDIVMWFVGDESTADETFSSAEQAKVIAFLENGGNLLVTGPEIGWDLSEKGTASDKAFYANYFKAEYKADGASGYNPATGISGSDFEGVSLDFGQVYPEDYPDEISAVAGAENILTYSNSKNAGVSYRGTFGSSSNTGAVVYLSFPLESVSDKAAITTFMQKMLASFEKAPTAVENLTAGYNIELFPVPVSDELNIRFNINSQSTTKVSVIDFSGKEVYSTTYKNIDKTNIYKVDVNFLKTGLYILKVQGKDISFSKKFVKE